MSSEVLSFHSLSVRWLQGLSWYPFIHFAISNFVSLFSSLSVLVVRYHSIKLFEELITYFIFFSVIVWFYWFLLLSLLFPLLPWFKFACSFFCPGHKQWKLQVSELLSTSHKFDMTYLILIWNHVYSFEIFLFDIQIT
jgi:high-affinity Fe2+/Pb2+ permease